MPSLDPTDHPLAAAMQQAFVALVDDGAVDIVRVEDDAEQDAYELQADEWTLHAEGWPIHDAWIALDTDVDDPAALRTALESALGPQDLAAMLELDSATNGDLCRGLNDSTDALSMALCALLSADTLD